jgi:hypothetical protein
MCVYMLICIKILFLFVSPIFGRNFAETKRNMAWRNEILFRDETENYLSGKLNLSPVTLCFAAIFVALLTAVGYMR